jgi:DNA-binding transcriptional ArsR family regulator
MSDPAKIARSCKALAHTRRVLLFEALAREPGLGQSYRALQKALKMPENSLVHHLDVMERGGLVHRRRDGSEVHVLLTPNALLQTLVAAGLTARQAVPPPQRTKRTAALSRKPRRSRPEALGA